MSFSVSKQLSVRLTYQGSSIPRSAYPQDWTRTMKDDYGLKSSYLADLHLTLDFFRQEILRIENALHNANIANSM